MRFHHIAVTTALALLAGCQSPAPRETLATDQGIGHPARVRPAAPVVAEVAPQGGAPRAATADEAAPADPLQARLQAAAGSLDPGVLALALSARRCAVASGEVAASSRLAVIDYSQPSTAKRLWVFDMRDGSLLFNEYVAHGQGSGDNYARRFSNRENSHQTSLGLFRTAETYIGGNGYSLRLDGLEPGYNDNARARAIVMHGAWYVNPDLAAKQGRLGRSYGCPALREQVAHVVIDTLKQENLLFAYADDADWLQHSHAFACDDRDAKRIMADARRPVLGDVVTASR